MGLAAALLVGAMVLAGGFYLRAHQVDQLVWPTDRLMQCRPGVLDVWGSENEIDETTRLVPYIIPVRSFSSKRSGGAPRNEQSMSQFPLCL